MSDINYDFKDLLNVGENFNLLYTQMLNGKRIRSEKRGLSMSLMKLDVEKRYLQLLQ